MTRESAIIELGHWWRSPPGQLLLAWEQRGLDQAVGDLFGFHALQLGLPELDGLRANRMPHRWLATDTLIDAPAVARPAVAQGLQAPVLPPVGPSLHCDFDALPFPANSLDLVLLPHTLELSREPHHTLREVERVLRPEGRVIIIGFNPASLWGLRQQAGHWRQRLGWGGPCFVPGAGHFIGYGRARDWLRLLGFEVEHSHFGCWRPPLRSEAWLQRWAWLERSGPLALPVLGAAYMVQAVKRVRGMRLLGLARRQPSAPAPRAVLTQREGPARRLAATIGARIDDQDPHQP